MKESNESNGNTCSAEENHEHESIGKTRNPFMGNYHFKEAVEAMNEQRRIASEMRAMYEGRVAAVWQ